MIKLRNVVFGGFAVVLSIQATPASAEFQPTADQRAACTNDAIKLCSAQIPNVERITTCLAAKKPQLSPRCRVYFDRPQAAR